MFDELNSPQVESQPCCSKWLNAPTETKLPIESEVARKSEQAAKQTANQNAEGGELEQTAKSSEMAGNEKMVKKKKPAIRTVKQIVQRHQQKTEGTKKRKNPTPQPQQQTKMKIYTQTQKRRQRRDKTREECVRSRGEKLRS